MDQYKEEYKKTNSSGKNEFDIVELFGIFWDSKIKIFFIGLFFATLIAFYSLTIPNIYTSKAILAPSNENSSNLMRLNQFSGLANIAGVSLPQSFGSNDSLKAIETMKSLDFFEELSLRDDIFFNLMAVVDWDRKNDTLKINQNMYDTNKNIWTSKMANAVNGKPSIQTAHRKFKRRFSVSMDKMSGLVYVSYSHYSPNIAKNTLESILDQIDNNYREEAIKNSENSIHYLKKEYDKNKINEVRTGISDLIQKHIETVTVANASTYYIFKQVSKPHSPELKSGPSRSVMVIMSFIISVFVAYTFIAINYYRKD